LALPGAKRVTQVSIVLPGHQQQRLIVSAEEAARKLIYFMNKLSGNIRKQCLDYIRVVSIEWRMLSNW